MHHYNPLYEIPQCMRLFWENAFPYSNYLCYTSQKAAVETLFNVFRRCVGPIFEPIKFHTTIGRVLLPVTAADSAGWESVEFPRWAS